MTPLDFHRPLTLKETCATQILSSDSDWGSDENTQHIFNNDILGKLWNRLKKKVPLGVLNFPIQIAKIEKNHRSLQGPLATPVEFKTSLYFKALAKTFYRPFKEANLDRLINNRIPVACQEYLQLQEELKKKWEDEALCILWNMEILRQLPGVPTFATAGEIRLWMDDPINAPLLLNIYQIKISNKHMKAIPPEIAKLSGLTHLNLSDNAIVIIDTLDQCPKLEHVDLHNNKISRCESLQKCTKITFLDLSMNCVSDTSPFSSLSELNELDLDHNQISTINPICELKKLRVLNLSRNQISTIDAIGELNQLRELYLSNNRISRIDSIAWCTLLEVLYLDANTISSITPIDRCTLLEGLNLENNEISEIDALGSCKQLQSLHLSNNKIDKIDSLRQCSKLVTVTLNDNMISTLAPLTSLKLGKLCAANNKISNIDSLTGRTALRALLLSMNQIRRIDPLGVCNRLTVLDLRKNKISSIIPLVNLPLKQLNLNNNPISLDDPFLYLKKLRQIIYHDHLHLFLIEKDIITVTGPELLSRIKFFLEYACLSSASNFLKIIALEKSNIPKIQEAFGQLENDDKRLINDAVCEELTFLSADTLVIDDGSLLSAEVLFSNIGLLQCAAKKAVMTKFGRLSEKSKQRVYREIHNLVNTTENQWEEPYALDVREELTKILWGKKHAFISPLLFADALANESKNEHVKTEIPCWLK